jgi:peptide/nickel transport system ATP-binding protein
VDAITIKIERGSITGLVGEKGCGKSTIARMVVKLLKPTSGRIILEGEDITTLPERRFRNYRKLIQIIFQHPEGALDPADTLEQSIYESFIRLKIPRHQWEERLTTLCEEVSLPLSILDRRPCQVSGGEIQRTAIARVLAFSPRYLILDEPTSMLDLSVQAQILALISSKARSAGMGVLLISHDMDVVRAVCDHVIVMRSGRIMESGSVEQIFRNPKESYTAEFIQSSTIQNLEYFSPN